MSPVGTSSAVSAAGPMQAKKYESPRLRRVNNRRSYPSNGLSELFMRAFPNTFGYNRFG